VTRSARARCHSPRSRPMRVRFPRRSSHIGRITGCRTPRRTCAPCCFPCHISSTASPTPKRERIGPVVSLAVGQRPERGIDGLDYLLNGRDSHPALHQTQVAFQKVDRGCRRSHRESKAKRASYARIEIVPAEIKIRAVGAAAGSRHTNSAELLHPSCAFS